LSTRDSDSLSAMTEVTEVFQLSPGKALTGN